MGKLRRLIASASVVAILSTLVVSSSAYAALDASKGVAADHWAYSYVEALVGSGAVNTTGAFNGGSNVIRADFAKMLGLHLDIEGDAKGSDVFDDVVAGSYYDVPVGVLNAAGVVSGDAGTKNFAPSRNVNRAEVAKMVVLARDLPAVDKTGKDLFSDVKAADWFNDEVGIAYCYGVVKGFADGTFGGGKYASRYEAAKMVAVEPELIDDCAADDTPADDTPADDTPADDTPADDTPADDTPADDTVSVTEGPVAITLSDSTPSATTLGDGTAYNGVLSFTASAGPDGGLIKGVTLQKSGLTTDSNVSGVSVWVGDTRYGNIVSVSEAVATVTFADDPITVPADGEVVVDVKINLDAAAGSGTVQFGLKSVDIGEGEASGLDTIVWGETFGTVDGSTSVGSLVIDSETYSTATRNVKMGTEKQPIAKFTFAGGANEKLEILEIRLRNNGNSSDGDITNIALVDQAAADTDLLVVAEGTTDKVVLFDFRDSPLPIDKGETKTYIVQGDVVSGSTRTTQFVIDNDYDVIVNGLTTSSGILATAGANEASFPIGDRASSAVYNQITGEEGSLSVSKDATSKSGNIGIGGKQIPVGTWKLEATGEDIEVRKVAFDLDNGDAGSLATVTNITGTVKLVKNYGTENEATVFSIAASDVDLYDDVLTANADEQFTMATYFTVPAGETATLTILVDTLSTAAAGLTMQATMANVYYKRLSSGTLNTAIATEVVANTLTSEVASVTLANNSNLPSGSIVAGVSDGLIGSFNLQAGSASGVSVQTIIVDVTVTGETAITEVTNLKLKDHATGLQIGSTVSSPVATDNSFNVSGGLKIAASNTATVDVYANLSTSAATATATGTVQSLIAAATDIVYVGDISNSSSSTGIAATNFQTMTVRGGGTLTVTRPSQTAQGVLHASETGVQMLAFNVEGRYEDIKIDKIFLSTNNASGNLTNFTLKDADGNPLKSGATVISNNVTFAGINDLVTKDGSETYYVYADVTGTGAMSSAVIGSVRLNGIDSTGQASGSTVVETSSTTEIGSTSSVGHYAVGDVILDSQAASRYGLVTATTANDDNFSLSGTGPTVALENTATAVEAIAVTDYIAKFPVIDKWLVSAATDNPAYAVGDLLFVYDAAGADSNNGLCIITTAEAVNSLTVGGGLTTSCEGAAAADITLAAGDRVTRLATATASNTDGNWAALTNAYTQGNMAWLIDASTAANNNLYVLMATFAAAGDASAASALIDTVTLANGADTLHVYTTVAKEAYSTASTNSYAAGEIVAIADASGDTSAFYVVDENFAAGTSFAANADITDPDLTLAANDVIAKLWNTSTAGNVKVLQDVEPTITLSSETVSSGISGASQKVAVYDVKANGPRDLYIESFDVRCTGSYSTNAGANDNEFKIYTAATTPANAAGELKVTSTATDCTVAAGHTMTFPSPGIKINAGQTLQFEVWYNTEATSGQASGESMQFVLNGTAGQTNGGAVGWYYTAADPSPGTEPTYASPTNYLDDYPVTGPTLTY